MAKSVPWLAPTGRARSRYPGQGIVETRGFLIRARSLVRTIGRSRDVDYADRDVRSTRAIDDFNPRGAGFSTRPGVSRAAGSAHGRPHLPHHGGTAGSV